MRCERFERRLQQLLDRRSRPEVDRRLRGHARRCPHCRATLQAQARLFRGLSANSATPSPDFTERVVARVAAAVERPTGPGWRVALAVALGTAACVSIAVGLPRHRSPSGSGHTQGQALEVRVPGPATVSSNLRDEQDARPGSIRAEGIGDNDGSRQVDARHLSYVLGNLPFEIPAMTLGEFGEVDQLADGLRPIATSFSVAIDALRRTIPVGKHSRSQKPQAEYLPATSTDQAV